MNYLFRNFASVLRKFTTSSIINIVGLSVALLVFFVVLIQVHYDLTYDRGYKNADRIALFNSYRENRDGMSDMVNFQVPARIKATIPELEDYCLLSRWNSDMFDIDKGNGNTEVHKVPHIEATSGFWNVFSPEILQGDTTGIFTSPGKAIISAKTAMRLFGSANPIGQVLRSHYGNSQYVVQAVYRDFPENSSLTNGMYSYLSEQPESEWSFQAYFLVQPEWLRAVNEKLNSDMLGEDMTKFREEHPEEPMPFRLSLLNDFYLKNPGKGGSERISTTVTLLVIGVLTLLIAFVNFVNLALAMAPARVRGINIRKILGANRNSLRLTIASESVLFTLLAVVIASFGLYFIQSLPLARSMFSANLALADNLGLLASATGVILLLSFLVGLYAMRYCTSFDEAEALKGSFAVGVKANGLRNVLIVVQFATAITLICISMLIKQQNDYMLHYDWGFDRENVVYVPLAGLGQQANAFGEELLRDPRIKDYTISRVLPGQETMAWGTVIEGKPVYLTIWSVDERFMDFFGVNMIAGRKPEHKDSIITQLVVNEAFLKEYEFAVNDVVGKDFNAFGPGRIQGVAQNINFMSLHESIKPMAFGVLAQWNNFQYLLVKLTGNDLVGAVEHIRQVWGDFSSEPFEVHFLDDHMDRLYQQETNMAKLIGLFGLLVVLIAVMGVYGLIVFTTKQKAKEIAIRKVNGSSVREILLMLNRNVLSLLGVAFVIAVPVAYYFIQRWLENFAYKTPVHAWVFLLGGLVVLAITLATVNGQSYRSATANPTRALNKE